MAIPRIFTNPTGFLGFTTLDRNNSYLSWFVTSMNQAGSTGEPLNSITGYIDPIAANWYQTGIQVSSFIGNVSIQLLRSMEIDVSYYAVAAADRFPRIVIFNQRTQQLIDLAPPTLELGADGNAFASTHFIIPSFVSDVDQLLIAIEQIGLEVDASATVRVGLHSQALQPVWS